MDFNSFSILALDIVFYCGMYGVTSSAFSYPEISEHY